MMGVALQEPVLIDLDAATTAVRPYAWLIDRVGDDGIKLTTAGYLPPVHVEAAFTELDLPTRGSASATASNSRSQYCVCGNPHSEWACCESTVGASW
jgi:hypothetical protein